MLKMTLRAETKGKPVRLVVLGLSHGNLDRLRQGHPITVDGGEVGLPGVELLIFSGETEQSMAREVAEFIGPETATKIDPRLRD